MVKPCWTALRISGSGSSAVHGAPSGRVSSHASIVSLVSLGFIFGPLSLPACHGSRCHIQQIAQKVLDSLRPGSVVQFQVERNPAAAGFKVPPGFMATGGTRNGKVYALPGSFAKDANAFKVLVFFDELFHGKHLD